MWAISAPNSPAPMVTDDEVDSIHSRETLLNEEIRQNVSETFMDVTDTEKGSNDEASSSDVTAPVALPSTSEQNPV